MSQEIGNGLSGPSPETLTERLASALPSSGTQIELSAIWQRLELTRFSHGRVHQNVADAGVRVWARAWNSGGAGYSIGSAVDPGSLKALVDEAVSNADATSGRAIELPAKADIGLDPFFSTTAELDAQGRARYVESIQEEIGDDAVAHGNIRVAIQSHALVNTAGLQTGFGATYAASNIVAQAEGRATGYAGVIGRDSDRLDFVAAARRAADIAKRGRHPIVIQPGNYEILLDPPAVSMLLVSLGYVGLNAFGAAAASADDAWHALDRVVASEHVNLSDDCLDPLTLFTPIDAEGTPRRRLALVTEGVVTAVAHDLTSASAEGVTTTGHALPPGDKGPAPHSLSIDPGPKTRDDIIAGMKRGLIVNRIHPFVSLRGGRDGELSGTTRDGVFLVENGEVVAPVANVRWSNSMTDLLGHVEAVSSERSVEFMDLPEHSPHTNHVPSLYSTRFTVQSSQPRER